MEFFHEDHEAKDRKPKVNLAGGNPRTDFEIIQRTRAKTQPQLQGTVTQELRSSLTSNQPLGKLPALTYSIEKAALPADQHSSLQTPSEPLLTLLQP